LHLPVKLEFGWVREGSRGRMRSVPSRPNPGTRLPVGGQAHVGEREYDSKGIECVCWRRYIEIRPFTGGRVWHSI
jgi:hypothetical protein